VTCKGVAVLAEQGEIVTLERCNNPECPREADGKDHLIVRVDGIPCLHIHGKPHSGLAVIDEFSKKTSAPPALSEGEIAELLATGC